MPATHGTVTVELNLNDGPCYLEIDADYCAVTGSGSLSNRESPDELILSEGATVHLCGHPDTPLPVPIKGRAARLIVEHLADAALADACWGDAT